MHSRLTARRRWFEAAGQIINRRVFQGVIKSLMLKILICWIKIGHGKRIERQTDTHCIHREK